MLKHPLLVVFVCLALSVTVTTYDASATTRPNGTKEESARSVKTVDSKSVGAVKKASAKSRTAAGVKKSSSKRKVQLAANAKSAQSKSVKARFTKKRKQKYPSRDPGSLPVVEAEFAEKPRVVLTALSTIPAEGEISSLYGMRRLSRKAKRGRMHTGVDIRAERGSPVLAAAAGVVSFVGRWAAYGKIVELDHGNGLVTRYAHLDKQLVEVGAQVASGEHIGLVGRTGRTTGAHLHFETLVNGRTVNPMMAEIWRQAPEHMAARRGTYVSGLRSTRRVYH